MFSVAPQAFLVEEVLDGSPGHHEEHQYVVGRAPILVCHKNVPIPTKVKIHQTPTQEMEQGSVRKYCLGKESVRDRNGDNSTNSINRGYTRGD
jgi:hypothetical protein